MYSYALVIYTCTIDTVLTNIRYQFYIVIYNTLDVHYMYVYIYLLKY